MPFYSSHAATKDQTEQQTKWLLLQRRDKEPGLVIRIMTNNPGPVGSVTSTSWCSCNYHCEMDNDFEQLCNMQSDKIHQPSTCKTYIICLTGGVCSISTQSHLFVRPTSNFPPIFFYDQPPISCHTPSYRCSIMYCTQHIYRKLHILGSLEQATKMFFLTN